jgi:hypothetical protein
MIYRVILFSTIILSILCCFGACKPASSQTERDLKSSMQRLNQMFQEYSRIPVKQKSYGDRYIAWKDEGMVKAFYETYNGEILAMDARLLAISNVNDDDNAWSDDAAFCRAILHVLWTLANPEKEILQRAIVVLKEFAQSSSRVHLEELTKATMQEAFLSKQKEFLTPSLSYEQNADIALEVYVSQLLIKLKAYDEAIQQLEHIAKAYPTSRYSEYLKDQIQAIKELKEGKITVPESLPE